jgi:hypothetical protein
MVDCPGCSREIGGLSVYLMLIDRDPKAVIKILHTKIVAMRRKGKGRPSGRPFCFME